MKFDIAMQMTPEHSLARRYKQVLSREHKELLITNT